LANQTPVRSQDFDEMNEQAKKSADRTTKKEFTQFGSNVVIASRATATAWHLSRLNPVVTPKLNNISQQHKTLFRN
jgi:hypothetical protein